MTNKEQLDELLFNKTTPEVARDLLGMYLEYVTPTGTVGGYIVDAEAYLGPEDEAAHSFGMRRTPRVAAMYEKPGTIYLYTMHTHRILNIITQPEGIPQGVMIRAIEPATGVAQMSINRGGKTGPDISNGPGKLVAALGLPQELYGQSILDSPLHFVFEKKKIPKKIMALPRIGIPNKGEWTDKPLRFVVAGNPYLSLQRKNLVEEDWGWRKRK
ncbi:DNA-3-methyladenine glycosylase [Enterococcus hirae]|uniref:Putative 3-methyladenine DNA glycosylase n=1 Tax=Enterococcus hirae TaxID=1354 RepID=A0AB37ICM8_ENTHR|nr:DNA-3-methyladenine glycosylase [Enterococcus hirae]EMF0485632.1 DNA-3-methyladenine glycosylase [Enterococcus hirae]PCE06271.1 3-methyladenine DNA glycosylase [Enterococcus hirae]RBT45864.1 DNA-3-methyladenine glycosylase [Enterococcus hirae]RBT48177.1 DNA-3-methyladenine glycosylase [Enterococcus hirae]RBT50587.1 DNA-3-methyladenine glycosylase [Enterococcus hirae]